MNAGSVVADIFRVAIRDLAAPILIVLVAGFFFRRYRK